MINDRMMQAIGRIERALTQLERAAAQPDVSTAMEPRPASRDDIANALKSLDSLIGDIRKSGHG